MWFCYEKSSVRRLFPFFFCLKQSIDNQLIEREKKRERKVVTGRAVVDGGKQ